MLIISEQLLTPRKQKSVISGFFSSLGNAISKVTDLISTQQRPLPASQWKTLAAGSTRRLQIAEGQLWIHLLGAATSNVRGSTFLLTWDTLAPLQLCEERDPQLAQFSIIHCHPLLGTLSGCSHSCLTTQYIRRFFLESSRWAAEYRLLNFSFCTRDDSEGSPFVRPKRVLPQRAAYRLSNCWMLRSWR
ncbi:unnamed protein product [Tetraodon nigroviridis]|uniref:Chromosome undetermined SCAF7096, whole genome shotgun sequence n=1 Tax=Tetraodon nigroviridis TaxID=99883 RepID=Q4TBS7_TETNG|nr:unnamed protein product [Tetraodon nigroviridis]